MSNMKGNKPIAMGSVHPNQKPNGISMPKKSQVTTANKAKGMKSPKI